jgi:hypothetical protein
MNILTTGGAGFIGFHLARFHTAWGDLVHVRDNLFKSEGRLDPDLDLLKQDPNVRVHLLNWLRGRKSIGPHCYPSASEVYAGCEVVGLLSISRRFAAVTSSSSAPHTRLERTVICRARKSMTSGASLMPDLSGPKPGG